MEEGEGGPVPPASFSFPSGQTLLLLPPLGVMLQTLSGHRRPNTEVLLLTQLLIKQ